MFQGELVYANYGEEKDFKLLSTKGVSCRDKIVIMRYGRIFPGRMVINRNIVCAYNSFIFEITHFIMRFNLI